MAFFWPSLYTEYFGAQYRVPPTVLQNTIVVVGARPDFDVVVGGVIVVVVVVVVEAFRVRLISVGFGPPSVTTVDVVGPEKVGAVGTVGTVVVVADATPPGTIVVVVLAGGTIVGAGGHASA